jgi:hypothetical protein
MVGVVPLERISKDPLKRADRLDRNRAETTSIRHSTRTEDSFHTHATHQPVRERDALRFVRRNTRKDACTVPTRSARGLNFASCCLNVAENFST